MMMKRILGLTAAALLLGQFSATAQRPAKRTGARKATTTAVATTAPAHLMTANGVGPVMLGAKVSSLSKAVDGLYDHIAITSEYDPVEQDTTTAASFTLAGKEVLSATVDSDGKITYITTESTLVGVKVGTAYFKPGMPLAQLRRAKGVRRDSDGVYAAVYGGIHFDGNTAGRIHAISVGSPW